MTDLPADRPWPSKEEAPELYGLRLDGFSLEEAWESEKDNLHRMIREQGTARACLTIMVQEYYLRTISTVDAMCYTLRDGNVTPFIVLLRHLYEVVVTFNFLMDRDTQSRDFEAQVAVAWQEFSTLAKIDAKELRDPDGKLRAVAEHTIQDMRAKFDQEALRIARERADDWSWTGRKIHHLLSHYGKFADDGFYGEISSLAHPHQKLIGEYTSLMTPARLEAGATHARRRVREVRWMMQRSLGLPFANEWLDSQRYPLRRVVRTFPHANIVDYRP